MALNIKDLCINDCFGCAVCAKVCPKHIIEVRLNKDGFFQPQISSVVNCIKCGLCVDVCSFYNEGVALVAQQVNAFAGWSNDVAVRQKCSSGGVGFELARVALSLGYKVCAVRYDVDQNVAEHYIATTVEQLNESVGSKYIQSNTLIGMRQIDPNDRYIVFGTPCHIDSFRRYLRKIRKEDNFILVDFFCHGVPSYLLWYKYLDHIKDRIGEIKRVKWRDKKDGWHDSWAMDIQGGTGHLYIKMSDGDLFLKTFLSDSCLSKACYDNCKFKYSKSSGDIRIGDAWGRLYRNNSQGVSAVVCFSKKGLSLLKQSNCRIIKHDFEQIAEYQMKENARRPLIYPYVQQLLRCNEPLNIRRLRLLLYIHTICRFPKRIITKGTKILR
uniref:Coenzyme F420 hydrogenase/dehydrogenase, beta subunit C-terminal domain n=1 Tax=Alistipes sp. Marseille-P5061 TaxID=2048242 RepID=UPI000D106F2D|nr:Coenzyme F420 hydrogenase/dehydrogenase, beta subunit C-terminal domain [Alistipes sp. Marseille-P5061]